MTSDWWDGMDAIPVEENGPIQRNPPSLKEIG
jgi:hypothetical protein